MKLAQLKISLGDAYRLRLQKIIPNFWLHR